MFWSPKMFVAILAIFLDILLEDTKANLNKQIHDWYMKRPRDDLPLIEEIMDCKCPRIYIPVCADNGRSFTNICKMNCYNSRLKPGENATKVLYVGKCFGYIENTEFDEKESTTEDIPEGYDADKVAKEKKKYEKQEKEKDAG